MPTAVAAAVIHRATGRGARGHRGDTGHSCTSGAAAVAIATDGARGLGYGKIGGDDGCSSGVGGWQRRADVMGMLGRNPTVHGLIVALLALR